ncbi:MULTISPECIES: hypothetical protein [Bacillus]|uniref:hypothetical protein n=1 Tax=Bacillus TaxID=1386 RepID=UPI00159BAEDE|nr:MULTISPECIES: hypothetical protein [Bacillus]HDR7690157.1 hypothetical protein [Bacillus toyonensis]HDX9657895.1 hypothetical protein [Bacillus toyonensis]
MVFENVSTIGALAFLFLMIYLATDPKDVSLLTIPVYFGGMWITNWITENGFQGTYIYHFSQEDSFLKEREVSRWEMNWLRTRDGRKPS